MLTRRSFTLGLTSTAFAGLALSGCATGAARGLGRTAVGYGPLVSDPERLFDLPQGFTYRVISAFGDRMDDGFVVPDCADGMGAIRLDERRVALVRNHELSPGNRKGPFGTSVPQAISGFDQAKGRPLPGGTTTIVYDYRAGRVDAQHLSLVGTIRNCAGGTTPWGSWLSCEETVERAGSGGLGQDHGWVFEVPAGHRGLADPVPLRAMGRFNHEAAAVDPRTGIVYLTEDRGDSLFYRFLPERPGRLAEGGRLQALAFRDPALASDSRNWSGTDFPPDEWRDVRWIDLEDVESAEDDLRTRGHARGAALFARGEGIHFGSGELYFCCTNGGPGWIGQIMRYRPSRCEGQPAEENSPGRLQLFVESRRKSMLNLGDNLTVAPNGHLIVCEDHYTPFTGNCMRGVTPNGALYDFARLRSNTELAGVCFSPDGATMFVNVYSPTKTLAITGPWGALEA